MARKNSASFNLDHTSLRMLALVKVESSLSYEEIASRLGVDRRTVITATKKLERLKHVVVLRPRGGKPNRYITTDGLIQIPSIGM